jgi:hypothetical protein
VGSRRKPEKQQGAESQFQRPPAPQASEPFHSITSSARARHLKAERPGGNQVDHPIEFRRLLDRNIARLRPAIVDIIARALEQVGDAHSIGHQAARLDIHILPGVIPSTLSLHQTGEVIGTHGQ